MAGKLFQSAAVLTALAATGCVSEGEQAKVNVAREEAGVRHRNPSGMSMTEARAFFTGSTRVVSAANLGSQVSYMAPDGSVHLWFPGNTNVVRGRWSLVASGRYVPVLGRPVESVDVCFEYGGNSFNAWTGERAKKECGNAEARLRMTQDRAEGDVFGLAQRVTVPFVLPAERTTVAALKARIR